MKTSADYPRAIKKSIEALADAKVSSFPLDLNVINKRYENLYEIRTYADFMREKNISRQECVRLLQSEDGATLPNDSTTCTIYYNELERNHQRIRFTLAHEIGHVLLDHVFDYIECTEDEMALLEKEANCFASNLLCPVYFVEKIFEANGIEKHEYDEIAKCYKWYVSEKKTTASRRVESQYSPEELLEINFDISHDAAITRIKLLSLNIQCYKNKDLGISYAPIQNARLTASWRCIRCNTKRLSDSVYCTNCGDRKSFVYDTQPAMEYRCGIKSTNNKYDICPICGNTDFSSDGIHCMICGSPRQNYCLKNNSHNNHPQAKFCKTCGNKTIYSQLGLNKIVTETFKNKSYTMNYVDIEVEDNGIPERCPVCDAPTYGLESVCSCGFDLENKCPICGSINSANARYCEYCGENTLFYKGHILNDWHKLKRNLL